MSDVDGVVSSTRTTKTIKMLSLSKTLALLLAATLAAADYGAVCEASDASPSSADVSDALDALYAKGGACIVNNGMGSDCESWKESGSASLSICGKFKATLACKDMVDYLRQVKQKCKDEGFTERVGGTFTVSDDIKVTISHS
ncbi:uncharacterized protein K452DRAFT_303507 [Aplosporella prunicola CBS 121167]|uniref:Ecp2 effector protein domain-containing protein n=1 Tax=Aplosporella prunicola CBS 121167 TaxID=1176127 RepID=A0A6A6AW56_9PEZI|nr:uncharacterized protein K452DRAFT_303507 [Aplosporella prunicola CBS 121167]KAF2135488.1 hypothetical protein K452DRAFT_303507 [Aplosporella prunicola CBS 121167]